MKLKHADALIVVLSLLVVGTQPALGTKYIPTDTSIGTWNAVDRVYTLTADVYETIQIAQDDLTLDGAGHAVTGPGTGIGVSLYKRMGVTVRDLTVKDFGSGIELRESSGNTLSGNTASNNGYGIFVTLSSSANTLTGNTTSNNTYGIFIHSNAGNNTVTTNTSDSNSHVGIYIHADANNNMVSGNVASNNMYGVQIWASSNNQIHNNNLSGNETAIIASGPDHQGNSYLDNDLSNSTSWALSISHDSQFEQSGNDFGHSVNGISLGNMDGVSLSNLDLSTIQGGTCLNLGAVTNSSFSNITVSGGVYGIHLYNSSGNTLIDNTASNNSMGIALRDCSNNTLTANTASSNSYTGVFLSHSSNNTLSDNMILNNDYGIYLHTYSSSNTLTGNTVNSNTTHGIAISPYCDSNTLTGNTVSNNQYGIMIWMSNDNQIHNNNFIHNARQASVGGSTGNLFNRDKPMGGNYWSDWTSPDTDSDGFVDVPYEFSGGQDDLPWADPDGWECRDPRDMIQELADQVLSLNLQHGISNSLDAKLGAALQALEDINQRNDVAAMNTLEAFINAVEAQRGTKIPEADADALIAKAQKIIDCAGGP